MLENNASSLANYLSGCNSRGFPEALSEQAGGREDRKGGEKLDASPGYFFLLQTYRNKMNSQVQVEAQLSLEVRAKKVCVVRRFALILPPPSPLRSHLTRIPPSCSKRSDRAICIAALDSQTHTNSS